MRRLFVCLLLVSGFTFAIFGAPAAAASVRGCANVSGGDVLQATNLSCKKVRRIVKAWALAYQRDGDYNCRVLGFNCRITPDRYEGEIGRCRRGSRVVRFYPNVPQ